MSDLPSIRLVDPDAERVRIAHARAIQEQRDLPASSLRVIRNVSMPDGVDVTVPHGLGREPVFVRESCARFANPGGTVRDFGSKHPVTGATIDRAKVIVLRADGFGSTIQIDLQVM